MGTEYLHPQDCLIGQRRIVPVIRNYSPSYPKSCRKQAFRQDPTSRRRRSSTSFSSDEAMAKGVVRAYVAMGQVTILKRGESLDSKIAATTTTKSHTHQNLKKTFSDSIIYGTERLGPDPKMVPKEIRLSDLQIRPDDVYAGSACYLSPSPRALPLPRFSVKKDGVGIDDSATKDLRRLLGLE